MEQIELQALVEKLSVEYFNQLFKHQASFNKRLRTTGGRYHLQSHDLDFNPRILDKFGLDVFEGIIKHELCHYHLHLTGRGYRHADVDFKQLLKQVDGLRYTPSIEKTQEKITRWEYQCQGCHQKVYRKRRFNVTKYVCMNCQNSFELKGQKELQINP